MNCFKHLNVWSEFYVLCEFFLDLNEKERGFLSGGVRECVVKQAFW